MSNLQQEHIASVEKTSGSAKKILKEDQKKSENNIITKLRDHHEEWLKRYWQSLTDQPITATVLFCVWKYQWNIGVTAKQLARILNMKTTAVYHHLAKLEEAGLIISIEDPNKSDERTKKRRYFEYRPDILYELTKKQYKICDKILENHESISTLIQNEDDLKEFKDAWHLHIQNRFKQGHRYKRKNDLRRSVSVVSAAAMETDKHLESISNEDYEHYHQEQKPFAVTMSLDKERYEELLQKIEDVVMPFIQRKPECTTKSESCHSKIPYTFSILALPPLISYRFTENCLDSTNDDE